MAGVDLRSIQELGGWSNLSLVMRYSHLAPAHKASAIERIAEHFPSSFTTTTQELIETKRLSLRKYK
jgi:hypothetical protein